MFLLVSNASFFQRIDVSDRNGPVAQLVRALL